MRFLSREWLEHLAVATSAARPAGAPAAGVDISVHQRVTGGPEGDVEYTLRLTGGKATIDPGPGRADVELLSDYATAAAISQGHLSPATAFAAGRLRVGGSVSALVAHQEVFADLGRVLAGVTEATTY